MYTVNGQSSVKSVLSVNTLFSVFEDTLKTVVTKKVQILYKSVHGLNLFLSRLVNFNFYHNFKRHILLSDTYFLSDINPVSGKMSFPEQYAFDTFNILEICYAPFYFK